MTWPLTLLALLTFLTPVVEVPADAPVAPVDPPVAPAAGGGARAGADEPVPPLEHEPAEVRERAGEVLARPEFRRSPTLQERVWGWIGEQLRRALGAVAGGGRVSWVAAAVGVAVVALAVAVVARAPAALRLVPRAGRGDGAAEAPPDAAEWRRRAEQHERAGEWRQAVRCRYRALVTALEAHAVVAEVPGATAGRHRQEVARNAPAAAGAFAAAADLFESVWYGGAAPGPDHSDRLQRLEGEVVAAVGP